MILCRFGCGTPKVHPLTKRAYAAPGICWKEDRQEMGCGKRRYFAQVLIARLAAIFDDSICESLIPHFSGAFLRLDTTNKTCHLGHFFSSTWIFKQSTKPCYCLVDATYFVKQRPLWPHGKNDKITTCQNKWQFCYLLVDNKSIKVFREQSSIARNYRLDSISGKLPKNVFLLRRPYSPPNS